MTHLSILQYMAFPMNILIASIWLAVLIFLYNKHRKRPAVVFMLSPCATIISIIAIIIGAIGIAFIPDFSTSTIFITILLYVLSNLTFVILRGYKDKNGIRVRFVMNHVGLWLLLFSGFIGAADTVNVDVIVYRNAPNNEAFQKDGESCFLDYKLMLHDFKVETSENGTPIDFEATVIIDRDTATLKVNHPYSRTLIEDIYLTGYDTNSGKDTPYCNIQIVSSPWKYFMFIGILMMLCGAAMLFLQGPKREKL